MSITHYGNIAVLCFHYQCYCSRLDLDFLSFSSLLCFGLIVVHVSGFISMNDTSSICVAAFFRIFRYAFSLFIFGTIYIPAVKSCELTAMCSHFRLVSTTLVDCLYSFNFSVKSNYFLMVSV
jgi:hypothetical protein